MSAVPFPTVDGEIHARQVAVAPDRTVYVVPSGMHERLRQVVAPNRTERDPKIALALAGWVCLQTDGMTDRVNVDASDNCTDATLVRRFARAHDAGSVAVSRHPSGSVTRSSNPATFEFAGPIDSNNES